MFYCFIACSFINRALNKFVKIMDIKTVTVKTNCIHCGSPMEIEAKVCKGKDFLNEEWLKKDEIYPDDPYTFIHLLCDRCNLTRGIDEDAHKK